MKVLRLEMEGFGPFRTRQEVDFTPFDADGLFVITGKTGAGKSTVLDAICFALYGEVPRYENADKSLRSDFCGDDDPTSVTLEFEVGPDVYKIWRSPDYVRAKRRGEGTTPKQAEAKLWRRRGGEWDALEVKPREVGHRVGDIMKLNADQFLQVILLAQGRFNQFLEADTKTRVAVLRSLFGTQRFERLEEHLRDIAREAWRRVEAADARLNDLIARAVTVAGGALEEVSSPAADAREAWLEDMRSALGALVTDARVRRDAAAVAATTAAAALTSAEATEKARVRLAQARESLVALEARADAVESERARLGAARRAQPVLAPLATLADAEERLATSEAAVPAARTDAGVDDSATHADARAQMVAAAERRGGLDSVIKVEDSIPRLERERKTADEVMAEAAGKRASAEKEIEEAPAELAALRSSLAGAIAALGELGALRDEEREARESAEAHSAAARLAEALATLREAEATASRERKDAVERHDAQVQARLRGEAARLAAVLQSGEPCPVCGSREHPAPALADGESATDELVKESREAADAATTALTDATGRAQACFLELGATRSRAVGELSQAEGRRDAAVAAVAAAERQFALREGFETAIATHTAEVDAKKALIGQLDVEIATASATRVATEQSLEQAREVVDRTRGEYPSVAALAAHVDRASGALQRLATVLEEIDGARAAVASARRAVDTAVAGAGCANADEARAAALPPAEADALAAGVAGYDTAIAGARAVVEELSTQDLPAEAVDLVPQREAAAEADRSRQTTTEEATVASGRANAFSDLANEYRVAAAHTATERAEAMTVRRLSETLQGNEPNERRMRLESFVLAARLERIIEAANVRLVTMSSGQYRLVFDDGRQHRNVEAGLGLKVFDAHTGRTRITKSLSGGETFLASLALALGLAETVTAEAGGIQLSTLFIDEGFGSLDGDTLEVAMSTLDGLRAGGRTVGLISHVDAMKEVIPAKLEVVKSANGSSCIQTFQASYQ